MTQWVVRFLVGGAVVSLFSTLADTLKPKSFAGLFAAAPSIALATLGLTMLADGKKYAAAESRAMIAGAIAFCFYASISSHLMMKRRIHSKLAALASLTVWFAISFGIWFLELR